MKLIKDFISTYFLSQNTPSLLNKKYVVFTSLQAVTFSKTVWPHKASTFWWDNCPGLSDSQM